MSGFVIKKEPPEFVVPEGSLDIFFEREVWENCQMLPADRQPDESAAVLYLLPSAFLELDAHIHWRTQIRSNQREQGGMMVGHVYRDKESQEICGVVQHVIPSEHAGNATYLQFTHEDWSQMLWAYEDRFPQQEDGQRPRIIGWYHTHPNMPTHMSLIDKRTHVSFWGKEWQFSVILNPQRGTWEVFNGTECSNCGGILYHDKQWVPEEPEQEQELEREQEPEQERESGQEQVPEQEHEPAPPVQQEAPPPSPGTFVIKRIPDLNPSPPPARHMSFPAAQPAPSHASHTSHMSHTQNSKYWMLRGVRYFPPYHDTDESKQYLVSQRFVQDMRWRMTRWDLPDSTSVSLTCLVQVCPEPLYRDSRSTHYELMHDGRVYTQGFEYENGLYGSLRFCSPPEGANWAQSQYLQSVPITLLYAAAPPDYPVLCKKYKSDFFLWFSTRNPHDFLFFCLKNRGWGRQDTSRFQIKSRPSQEAAHFTNFALRGEDLFRQLQEALPDKYAVTEPCAAAAYSYALRRISIKRLELLFQRLTSYMPVANRFCAAIGYIDEAHANSDIVTMDPLNISELKIFAEERYSCFQKLGAYTERQPDFLFVLSNYEIDIRWLKVNFPRYVTAFCVNLDDHSHHFYRLH